MTILRPLVEQLKNLLNDTLEDTNTEFDANTLVQKLDDITNSLLLLTNRASSILADRKETVEAKGLAFEVNTRLNQSAKQLLLLIRDTLVENNKAHIYVAEEKATNDSLITFNEKTKESILIAITSFISSTEEILSMTNQPANLKSAFEKSRLIEDPQAMYAEQHKDIQEQAHMIKDQKEELLSIIEVIKPLSIQLNNKMDSQLENFHDLGTQMKEFIKALENTKDFDEAEMNSKLDYLVLFSQQELSNEELIISVKQQLQDLPRNNYIVGSRNGQLLTRDIDFKVTINRWLDVKLMPFLIEVLESYKELQSRVGIALLNTKNKISLTKPENLEDGKSDMLPVLSQLEKDIDTQFIAISGTIVNQKKMINTEMRLSRLFENKEFLYYGLQGTVNQAIKAQNDKLNQLIKASQEKLNSIVAITQEWKQPKRSSTKEEIAQCLYTRINKKSTEIYDQVFQNNPFLSEVFLVPREQKEAKANVAVKHWREGSHSSILISGSPLSGKSTLAKKIANHYSTRHSFHVEPNSSLSCYGNRIKVGINLKVALDHINSFANNMSPLIVIDDLELWQGKEQSILDNVEALINFLSRRGNRVMVVATMSPVLFSKLNLFFNLKNYFFSTIDVSKCRFEEVEKTISVRHAATHKKLVNERGDEITSARKKRIIKTLYRQSHGNIGDILQRWTFGTQEVSANQVVFKHKYSELPSIVNSNNETLIESLFLYKKLREQDLLDLFGRSVFEKYRDGLKQLLNEQIIIRDAEGCLSINPAIANDLMKEYRDHQKIVTLT